MAAAGVVTVKMSPQGATPRLVVTPGVQWHILAVRSSRQKLNA